MPETCTIAVAHQKGGVGKTTTTLLLAHELADLRPDWRVLVEDLDPYRHLTQRWPGDRLTLALVDDGTGQGDIRLRALTVPTMVHPVAPYLTSF